MLKPELDWRRGRSSGGLRPDAGSGIGNEKKGGRPSGRSPRWLPVP